MSPAPAHRRRSHRRGGASRTTARTVSLALLLGILLLLGGHGAIALESFDARCVAVLDGDSIRVLRSGEQIEVRLEGIDAPERHQAYADRAKEALSALVYGKDVEVARVTTDNYGRYVSRVFVGDLNVNLEMVRRGLAWHYKRYSKDPALEAAEATARARRAGLWVDPGAVPPWSFRRDAAVAGSSTPPASQPRASSSPGTTSGAVHGNVSSRVFHTASCPNSHCRNCTAVFPSAKQAEAAGYRPAGCCHSASR